MLANLWQQTEGSVSLSLVLWFVSFSIFLLILGPVSDKIGRKPVLLGGLCVFVVSSVLCGISDNLAQLITFRILQGAGAAAPSSMCMAICRDRYEGIQRKHTLAYIGVILSVMPMLAPLIGSFLMRYISWRAIFFVQGGLATIALAASLKYRETLSKAFEGSIVNVLSRYLVLVRNKNFMLTNKSMGLILGPFYGFISFSTIVYIKIFGLSPHAFSLLFGLNALMSMSGAFTCTRLTRYLPDAALITLCLAGCLTGGLGILFFGHYHFMAFSLSMCLFSFCCGVSRPLSNNLILEQVQTDIGSASSFIVFYQFIVGSICMAVASVNWRHPILAFGLMASMMPLAVLISWSVLCRRLSKTQQC
jgi:DHA1 family bicyclomycin/chloramphenicol resistance-like MFS transporter